MPRRAPNISEYFERASTAKKIVSVQELGLRLHEIANGERDVKDYNFRPLPPFELSEITKILCAHYSNDETYEWKKGLKSSEMVHGRIFKSGRAIGYDMLIDIANGFEVDPRVLYTAFEACENHAQKLKKGHMKPRNQYHND